MRIFFILGSMALALAATGCGSPNKAEQVIQRLIDESNKVADAAEKGDKAAIKAGMARIAALSKEAESVKVTKSQGDAVGEKYKSQVEAAGKRMAEALANALKSGKLSPADMLELAPKGG